MSTVEKDEDAVAARIVNIEPARLKPHPENPRNGLTEADVADLVESIGAIGQNQPAIVRPTNSGFQIIVGHRRALACKVLEMPVACVIQDMDDDEALAVMLADNLQRTDPDPLLEARAVRAFLARDGWDVRQTAAVLGKSIGWVAGRSVLARLDPEVAKELREREWGIGALEEYARLEVPTQIEFLERTNFVRDREHLRSILADGLHKLAIAPWDVNDDALVPAAGSCAACPKTSIHSPGLFEEEDVENQDVTKATCRDAVCWAGKRSANQARAAAVYLEKEPDLVLVDGSGQHSSNADTYYPWAPKGKVLSKWDFRIETSPFRGGVKALELTTEGGVRAIWVQAMRGTEAAKKVQAPEPDEAAAKEEKKKAPAVSPAEKLRRSQESIAARRKAEVVDAVAAALAKFRGPVPAKAGYALAAGYQLDGVVDGKGNGVYGKSARTHRVLAMAAHDENREAWSTAIWMRARAGVARALSRQLPDELDFEYLEAKELTSILGIPVEPFEAAALEAVPDPKWWGAAAKKADAAPAAGKKAKAPKKKASKK